MRQFLILAGASLALAACSGGSEPDYDRATEEIAAAIEDAYVDRDAAAQLAADTRSLIGADFPSARDYARLMTSGLRQLTGDDHFHVSLDETEAAGDRVNDILGDSETYPGNVARIEINAFPASADGIDALSDAIMAHASADAILLDVRNNSGGDPLGVQRVASHFLTADTPVLFRIVYSDGRADEVFENEVASLSLSRPDVPLYVLVSSRTFSAGESLAWALGGFDRAIIVGEPTAGAAYLTTEIRVSGGFTFQLPHARPVHPVVDGDWQGAGIQPDIAVAARAAADAAIVDFLGRQTALDDDAVRFLETARERLSSRDTELASDVSGQYGPFRVMRDTYGLRMYNPQQDEWRSLEQIAENSYQLAGMDSAVISFVYEGERVTGLHVDFPDGSEPPLDFPRSDLTD